MSDFFKFMMTVALRGSVTEPHEDVEDTNFEVYEVRTTCNFYYTELKQINCSLDGELTT